MARQTGNWFGETRSLYIARPDERMADLIYKHPDHSIPRGAKLTVRSSECALFFREGHYIGRIDAGSIQLDTANFPFLGHLVIDKLTAGNHFLCELFFVSLNETILRIPDDDLGPPTVQLGQYKDLNSARVVNVRASLSYTVKVQDPEGLIKELGGQRKDSAAGVKEVLDGRLLNQLRRVVGEQIRKRAILDVVSNVDAEEMSTEVRELGHKEFVTLGIGIGRMFHLELSLDDESLEALREFGKRESDLALQAKGAELARHDGFAQFNYVQGQRAAMEGLGKGLATGSSPMIMTGVNVGGAFPPPGAGVAPPRPTPRGPAGSGGQILTTPATYIIVQADGSETGPYSARQLALIAISKGLSLDQVILRRSDDPPDVTFTADMEPQIGAEFQRRSPGARRPPPPPPNTG